MAGAKWAELVGVGDVRVTTMDGRAALIAGAHRWNKRISMTIAVMAGMAVSIILWALAIDATSWVGVVLGWWPALIIGAAVTYLVGKAWPILLVVLAIGLLVFGFSGLTMASAKSSRPPAASYVETMVRPQGGPN